jgi:hypothetical protein
MSIAVRGVITAGGVPQKSTRSLKGLPSAGSLRLAILWKTKVSLVNVLESRNIICFKGTLCYTHCRFMPVNIPEISIHMILEWQ